MYMKMKNGTTKYERKPSVMKQIFDKYIDETITDEQIIRVLEPVIRLIRKGAFSRPRRLFGLGGKRSSRPVDS